VRLFKNVLEMLTGHNKPQHKSTNLTRREFFTAIGATFVTSAIVTAPALMQALELALPIGDSWRFGFWLPEDQNALRTKPALYYGLDTENPMDLRVWFADPTSKELLEEISLEAAKLLAGYEEGVAEINIAQGYAGLKATGGIGMIRGDEADFDEIERVDLSLEEMRAQADEAFEKQLDAQEPVMLTGHDEASVERAVHEASGRADVESLKELLKEPGPKDT
jgi:hypothetical protein